MKITSTNSASECSLIQKIDCLTAITPFNFPFFFETKIISFLFLNLLYTMIQVFTIYWVEQEIETEKKKIH